MKLNSSESLFLKSSLNDISTDISDSGSSWGESVPFQDVGTNKSYSEEKKDESDWIIQKDSKRECYKILTEDKVLPVDGTPNQEQQWIADVFDYTDAVNIVNKHNQKSSEF